MGAMKGSAARTGYLVAVIAPVVVVAIRLALNEPLAEQARLLPLVVAVIAAAWWGGLWPGVLATLLGAFLGVLFIVPPQYSLRIESLADGLNTAIFLLVGVTISLICEALHAAQRSEAEKQFCTLANSMAQLVWIARPDGHRFWFNERWHDYTGATPAQSAGDGWLANCDPADVEHVRQSWRAAVASGTPWEATYRLRRKDGQSRWFLVRAVPFRDESGTITRWFGTSTDIHDRMELEAALKDADRRKDEYLATLAHELRNPLSPIASALQLLPRVCDDKAEMEHLRAVMVRQVKQLSRLIDDLLDVARITRGKLALQRATVAVQSLIAEAVESVQPLVDARRHQLFVAAPAEPALVNGDRARLVQVFSNLLHNAAKYTPCGGVIRVLVQPRESRVAVRIQDNGPGIPDELLSKVFEPFFQVGRTLDSVQAGLGIGLTLARQLVALHGGEITAANPGQGCEFVVTLPGLPAGTSAAEPRDPTVPALPPARLARHRLLVVDDNRDAAETLAALLRALGQEATFALHGDAAIAWTKAHRPDAVLLDLAMPGLNGYEVARTLRQDPNLHDVKLIALTGYGQHQDRSAALEAGFDFYLVKPAIAQELADLLAGLPAQAPHELAADSHC